jgi:acetate kinase
MKPANPRILTINGGSSSIKFALFEADGSLRRIVEGGIERIELPEASLRMKGLNPEDNFSRPLAVPDLTAAVVALMDWIEERLGRVAPCAVGHRVVHGVMVAIAVCRTLNLKIERAQGLENGETR